MSLTYDLFGNGRTAVKASLGRYVNKPGVTITRAINPFESSVNQVNRTWTDANNNFFPDCDLRLVTSNGLLYANPLARLFEFVGGMCIAPA